MVSVTHALRPGARLDWYRIERILGRGGFGVVYLARDTNLEHDVAVKEYVPGEICLRDDDGCVRSASPALDRAYRRGLVRFVTEARNLARFRHPNIVRVMSVFERNGTAYMVMEFENGPDLREHFRTVPDARSEAALRRIVKPIAEGLAEVHRHGFVHRDIKPSNILVRADGSPVLLDFGSARLADAGPGTQNLTALVSAGYAPLEQYDTGNGKDGLQGPWTDIYALGGVLYHAVAGGDPADSTRRASAVFNDGQDPLLPATLVGEGRYDRAFLEAIDWALSFRRADRPQTLDEWLRALLPDARPDAPPGDVRSPSSTGAVVAAALAAAPSEPGRAAARSARPSPSSAERSSSSVAAGSGSRSKGRVRPVLPGLAGVGFLVGVMWFVAGETFPDPAASTRQSDDATGVENRREEKASRRQAEADRQAGIERRAEAERRGEVERQGDVERQAEIARLAEIEQKEVERRAELEQREENERKAVEREAEIERQAEAERQAAAERQAETERQAEAERQAETERQAEIERRAEVAQRSREAEAAVLAARLPITDDDIAGVLERFEALRTAIVERDADAMDALTASSSQNDLFRRLMSNFVELDVSLGDIRVRNADKAVASTLTIRTMVRENGDRAEPSEAYRERRIVSERRDDGWSSIEW